MREYRQYIGKVAKCTCDLDYDCGFNMVGDKGSDHLIQELLEGYDGKTIKITVEAIDEE